MRRACACCEALEGRRLLAGVGCDLALENGAMAVTAVGYRPGTPWGVAVDVRNVGEARVARALVGVYLSADAAAGDDLPSGLPEAVEVFAAGENVVRVGIAGLVPDRAGTWYPVLVVRPGTDDPADVNPANDVLVLPAMTIEPTTVDVAAVGGTQPAMGSLAAGCSVTVYPVVNVIDQPTAVVWGPPQWGVAVSYALSTDDVAGNDLVIEGGAAFWMGGPGRVWVPWGVRTLGPASFLIPKGTAAGTYRLVMSVKVTGAVVDANPADNVVVGPEVTVLEPDLEAQLVPVTDGNGVIGPAAAAAARSATAPPAVEAGRVERGVLRLTNRGSKAVVRTYRMKLIASADRVWSPDDAVFARRTIRVSVPAGRTAAAHFTYALPRGAAPGTRYVIAVADVAGGHATAAAAPAGKMTTPRVEAAARVRVLAPRLDARVSAVRPEGGGTTAVTLRVTNTGTAPEDGAVPRILTVTRVSDGIDLNSVRRTLRIDPGRYREIVVRVAGDYAEPELLLVSIW